MLSRHTLKGSTMDSSHGQNSKNSEEQNDHQRTVGSQEVEYATTSSSSTRRRGKHQQHRRDQPSPPPPPPQQRQEYSMIASHNDNNNDLHNHPLIYSAPTVDTLGDESVSVRPYTTTNNNDNGSTSRRSMVTSLQRSSATKTVKIMTTATTTKTSSLEENPSLPSRQNAMTTTSTTAAAEFYSSSAWTTTQPPQQQTQKLKRKVRRSTNSSLVPPEFQRLEDRMNLSIRRIPVAERSAFDVTPAPPIQDILQEEQWKKVSPSPQHLYWIHKLQNMDHIRQLVFSPSVGSSSDVLYPFSPNSTIGRITSKQRRQRSTTQQDGKTSSSSSPPTSTSEMKSKKGRFLSDGRYRSIDPVQATMIELPSSKNPPLLSNKRHRLPMRADVGFPNATIEEIQLKQQEIRQESEWEEASPRLIVLVTSDDLGTAVATVHPKSSSSSSSSLVASSTATTLASMPFAGPELLAAKWQNQLHFQSKKSSKLSNTTATTNLPTTATSTTDATTITTSTTTTTKEQSSADRVIVANRYSILAPPLDASYSSTMGWKPRPFHDRPPGMRYALVSPIRLEFGIGNIEPLVCSLTLYSLTGGECSHDHGILLGKTTEEFYFPAGNWQGKLQLNEWYPKKMDGDPGEALKSEQSWLKRKHKALFALDPLVVPKEHLYVVLKVYTVTHVESAAAYMMGGSTGNSNTFTEVCADSSKTDRKTWKRQLRKEFHKSRTPEACAQRASYRASANFDSFGTQFLSPLCFGVTPLHKRSSSGASLDYSWPVGQVHEDVSLYAFPTIPESHDEFVQRLQTMVFPNVAKTDILDRTPPGPSSTISHPSSTSSDGLDTTPQRRKGLGRFITPKKPSRKDHDEQESESSAVTSSSARLKNKKLEMTSRIHGNVALYISDMDVDFLEAILHTPSQLEEDRAPGDRSLEGIPELPKLLADVSGRCGIMMDPTANGVNDTKRSNLLRLPPSENGYMQAADFREVWFLPPMSPKLHHVDSPPSYRSLLNLLYIYPRLLRHSGLPAKPPRKGSTKNSPTYYTIEVSLIDSVADKQQSGIVEAQTHQLKKFHNPAPWAGPSFVNSVNTKIVGDGKSLDDLKVGIPLQDEFKMQLPAVVDGNQFLRFTLCLVELSDDLDDASHRTADDNNPEDYPTITVQRLAEISIPLSSYASRDPAFGTKVTTVIPNGVHRIKLGDFQLHVETRLLSSTHVADPSLATALREFPLPIVTDSVGHGPTDFSLSSKDKSGSNERVTFAALFASANPSSLLCHFRTLLFMHLASLVSEKQNSNVVATEKFLSDCMDSLLEVCDRTRKLFQKDNMDTLRFQTFIKGVLDAYDEAYFHSSGIQETSASEVADDEEESDINRIELTDSGKSQGQDEDIAELDGEAIRRRKKDAFRNEIDTRISRTFSAMESPSSATFLRTAYGATKTDRMRLEAELGASSSRYTHLVDDDETVVTFATGYSGDARMLEAREAFDRVKTPRAADKGDVRVADGSGTDASPAPHDFSYKSLSETLLIQRVRSAAKVMLAPCVPPNFFGPITTADDSVGKEGKTPVGDRTLRSIEEEGAATTDVDIGDRVVAMVGSDVEDEGSQAEKEADSLLYSVLSGAAFRSPCNCSVMRFSVTVKLEAISSNSMIPLVRAEFVYESILLLWLHSISKASSKKNEKEDGTVQKIYDNMDLLLPLCTKSIALRFGLVAKNSSSSTGRIIIDMEHIAIFESFFEKVPLLLLREAMAGLESQDKETILHHVLTKSEHIIDFLIALYAILHPAHTAVLTRKLFQSLGSPETEGWDQEKVDGDPIWTDENLHRIMCSRQLRLRAVERLAVLPNFVALNYPLRFPNKVLPPRAKRASWKAQHRDRHADTPLKSQDLLKEDEKVFPSSGWLAEILTKEAMSISALSCEAVVAEAMAHVEERKPESSSDKKRPTTSLTREDLLMFQSVAIHGITCVHELLLRRHSMDRRFQKDSTRSRIASLFALPIFEQALSSIRWLARMESTHRIRSLWLLCFTYVLQEAPENLLREAVSSFNCSKEIQIHRFVRLLRLCSSTFQSFIDQQRYCMFPSEIDSSISPWLLQESFNTICATSIIVVEECSGPNSSGKTDQKKLVHGVLDLLLHILTTPQSTVTHLRAVGGAIQALEGFGAAMFMETTGSSLQHWIRVILGLMNSIALSVRSIAVDFVVSLLGSSFNLYGSIDELAIIFATVLPEVAAREIGLCSVSGHIYSLDDAERAVWPLRRSLADLEDANPVDDDRVDTQLSPVLSIFCRACQAILDGVLIELRLEGKTCEIVGSTVRPNPLEMYAFDADEESLFEAANFFLPESAPIQRLRWLLTLKKLHTAKGQWVEAAESLILCARAIADSIPHLESVWRPSRFPLWSDSRRSLWLSTVGEDLGIPERGNDQVMSFADKFLEPAMFEQLSETTSDPGISKQLTVTLMCDTITTLAKEALAMYELEGGLDELAYSRLEALLMILMGVLEDQGSWAVNPVTTSKRVGILERRRRVEDEAALRKVIASISGYMTKQAERILLLDVSSMRNTPRSNIKRCEHFFIRVLLSGKKPIRFTESTTLPAFLEWDTPCICRVPRVSVDKALQTVGRSSDRLEETMCSTFVKPVRNALIRNDVPQSTIIFRLGTQSPSPSDDSSMVYVDVGFVQMSGLGNDRGVAFGADRMSGSSPRSRDDFTGGDDWRNLPSKHFTYRKPPSASQVISSTYVEVTVASPFPCPLSRQRSLLTSEFGSNT